MTSGGTTAFAARTGTPSGQPATDSTLSGTALTQEFADRRSEPRFRMDSKQLIQIGRLDGESDSVGAIMDVSGSGLRIRSAAYFQPGSVVNLNMTPLLVTAEVRYCMKAEAGVYDTGLRILSAQSI